MKKIKIIIALIFIAKLNYTNAQGLLTGLQACYPLDCNVTNMASTGSSLDGTPVGVTCTTDRFGNPNSAYAFAGTTTSYIDLPNDVRIRPNTISFSAWVKFSSVTTSQYIVFTKNTCFNYFEGYALTGTYIGGTFKLQVTKSSNGCSPATQQAVFGASNLSANTWYHVGFYADNTNIEIYKDGALDGSAASTVTFDYSTNTNVYLGGSNVSYFNLPFKGDMDNVRFYNRRLTASEFSTLYTANPVCSQPAALGLLNGLEACYPLDCNFKNYAPTSLVPPSLDGTGSNVSCTTGHTGVANTAYKFAGTTTSYIELPADYRLKPTAISFSGWSIINNLKPAQYILYTANGCGSWFEGYALAAADAGGGMVQYQVVKATFPCGTQAVLNSLGTYPANQWNHVVFFMDGNNMKLYVNGVLDNSNTSGIPLTYSTTKVYLGGTNVSFNKPFDGAMDNLRFYSRELTAQEVTILYKRDPACDLSWCLNPADPNCREYMNKTVGLDKNNAAENTITELYPNPSNGKFYVRGTRNTAITIYDIAGKAVQFNTTAVDETTSEITLSNKAEGIYFVKIADKNGNILQTNKIVITH